MSSNEKAWYESKGIWGGIVTLLSIIAGVFGYQLSAEDTEALTLALAAIGTTVGTLLGIYGRVKGTKGIRR